MSSSFVVGCKLHLQGFYPVAELLCARDDVIRHHLYHPVLFCNFLGDGAAVNAVKGADPAVIVLGQPGVAHAVGHGGQNKNGILLCRNVRMGPAMVHQPPIKVGVKVVRHD